MTTDALAPYDAILLLSFGGPEAPEEVLPFLRRVTAGKGIPDDRLAAVGEHYGLFGGRSPINDLNRALIADLRAELDRRGLGTPIVWGNRNSEPFLPDALRSAQEAGARRIVTVVTSAYSSYSSCRQYRENLAAALEEVDSDDLVIDKVRPYFDHPAFSRANARLVTEAVQAARAAAGDPAGVRLLFVTHSVPEAMNDTSGPGDAEEGVYARQHVALAAAITAHVGEVVGDEDLDGELVFCSRSGPPTQPWLEPDVNDRITELAAEGASDIVLAPIGFVSDHMEVVYDLDTEAAATCAELGLRLHRVPTAGGDPAFAAGLVDLLLERAAEARDEPVVPVTWPLGHAMPSVCSPGCCPNLRATAPALCGRD
ncbi:ferrochelatase [Janibacter sp. G1551]|uniref:ferrochelatase n=1 Tax=Janibacter sp. G1551 TaxID=3420440 RepID=UPI003D06E71F